MDKTTLNHLLLLIVIISAINAQVIIEAPENTAGQPGDSIRLNCTADLGSDVLEWRQYLEGSTTRIWISNSGDQPEDTRFQVIQIGNKYDLVIPSLSEELVGTYACRLLIADIGPQVEVLTVDAMICSPTPPPVVSEGTELLLICATGYTGYLQPKVEWWSMNGQIDADVEVDVETGEIVATSSIVATRELENTPLECRLYFEKDVDEDPDAPAYTDSCSTQYSFGYDLTSAATDPDACSDITGVWQAETPDGSRAVIIENPDGTLEGLYRNNSIGGWFNLEGRRGPGKGDAFAFHVLWQGGIIATGFAGQCQSCSTEYLEVSSVTVYPQAEECGFYPTTTKLKERMERDGSMKDATDIIGMYKDNQLSGL